MQDSKDLEMIKGYVARLYTLVRSRTDIIKDWLRKPEKYL